MSQNIQSYFRIEARELVDRLTRGIASLDPAAPDAAALQDLLRAAHTLKGAAHVVRETAIATLAHQFEDVVAGFKADPTREGPALLLALTDQIAAAIRGAAGETAGVSPSATPTPAGEFAPGGTGESAPAGQPSALYSAAPQPAGQQPAVEPDRSIAQTIRVDLVDTESILEHISESAVLAASMRRALGSLNEAATLFHLFTAESAESRNAHTAAIPAEVRAAAEDLAQLLERTRLETADHLDRLDRELHQLHLTASQLRLVPAESLLLEAERTARATARVLRKQIRCTTVGGQERVDLYVLAAMQDAMLHLVRNALAHGIEPPTARIAQGKPAAGSLSLEVRRDRSQIQFVCRDDGGGIALDPIRAAAIRGRILTPQEAVEASSDELLALILLPGFSTAESLDQVSGRGIGLDAVTTIAARLRGSVHISTDPGRGTTITVTVPQALFSTDCLLFEVGGGRYALPLDSVEQTFLLDRHQIFHDQQGATLLSGRQSMPFLMLQEVLPAAAAAPHSNASTMQACLSLCAGSQRAALGVDRVLGVSRMLVRDLPRHAAGSGLVAGATLDCDGNPQVVLDPAGLIAAASRSRSHGTAGEAPRSRAQEAEKAAGSLPILVIDDSLTTRMLEQSILQSEGYKVDLAVSAGQALEMARAKSYALFLCDVEMPEMDGFEFVAATRADPKLKRTPTILVTSRNSAADRERGRAAGAASYIVKGEFDQKLFLDRIRALTGGSR